MVKAEEPKLKIVSSMEEIDSGNDIEYKVIDGYKDEEKVMIGSLTAGDLIEWSESNDGPAKRTAGLRLITKSLVGPEPDYVRYAVNPKNIEVFRRKSHKRTEAIVKEILALNGMEVKQDTAAKNE